MDSHWLFEGESFNPPYEEIEDAGFVYCITNLLTDKKYIGRKILHARRTLPPLKGRKNKRRIVKESDWREYCSSCQELIKDIEELGKENFRFEIISFHPNRVELNYHETKLLVLLNVLDARDSEGNRLFYNQNIETKFYPTELYIKEREKLNLYYREMVDRFYSPDPEQTIP